VHDEPEFGSQPFPRAPLIAAATLIAVTLIGVGVARYTGFDPRVAPPAPTLQVRSLAFIARPDGTMTVLDTSTGQEVTTLPPGDEGFVRATLRSLDRERNRQHVPPETPYRFLAHADGHLTLEDPATGRTFDLGSFGPTNLAAFSRLLNPASPAR
jgi:putative photosynthetic complex assembly protein